MQAIWWAYDISKQPKGGTLIGAFKNINLFLNYLAGMQVTRLSQINAMHCANYVTHCRQLPGKKGNKTLSSGTLAQRFLGVKSLWEMTQDTQHQFAHPWPDSSANHLAGQTGKGNNTGKSKTLIIPDEQLKPLMQEAMQCIEQANSLLPLRDEIMLQRAQLKAQEYSIENISYKLNRTLSQGGYIGALRQFNPELQAIQSACMIVILTLSGIRVHELGYLKSDAWYFTEDDDGEKTYWMKGRSDKTDEGDCEWLIPEVVTQALDVAQAYAAPLQAQWAEQRQALLAIDPNCKIAYAMARHEDALFVDVSARNNNRVGGLGLLTILRRINDFAKSCGVIMHLTPHQFRRTFAVAVAKSAYGDLRYLRQHFKHWSLDMTILYALNDKQDAELYDEIMASVVSGNVERVAHWLEEETLLSGGSAQQIRTFRSNNETVRTYKTRYELALKISDKVFLRANGTAWCTADNRNCGGHGVIENTLCADCEGSIIDDSKVIFWMGAFEHTLELELLDDIGGAGAARIKRDIERCRKVLKDLGVLEACEKAYRKKKISHESE